MRWKTSTECQRGRYLLRRFSFTMRSIALLFCVGLFSGGDPPAAYALRIVCAGAYQIAATNSSTVKFADRIRLRSVPLATSL